MVSTVSLTVKKQLDDKWAAALSQALCDAAEDTARLVRMPDHRFALVLTGFGAGKVGARRLHEPKPETDLVAISSTMRTRVSKSASKMRCSCSRSGERPARSYLMGARAVPSGRCGIASCTRRWVSFSSKSATPPVGQGRDAWWGDWGAGKKMLHDSAVRVSSQPIFIGAAERRWKAYAHIRSPKRIRNWCECTITCLRRKRSYP